LTVKTSLIFEKQFTIFKTVNRFPKLNSSFLNVRLISDCQNLAIVNRRNPTGAEARQRLVTGILPAPESSHRRRMPAGILPDLTTDQAESGRI